MSEMALETSALPVGGVGHRGVGWWGVLCLIASEGSIFAYLLFSYYFYAVQDKGFVPTPHPSLKLAGPNTLILILSSVAVWWGERGARRGRTGRLALGLIIAIALGAAFLSIQWLEWRSKRFSLSSSVYGSIYFVTTGFHMAHVAVGVLALAALLLWSSLGLFDGRRHAPVLIGAAYWHFVDAVWLTLFFTFYITPFLW